MPLLTDLSDEDDWVEPDLVPRPVVTYGFASDTFGECELEPHRHAKSQILLVQRGALACEVAGGLWVVPPRSALWIPGRTLHTLRMTGALEGYGAFITTDGDPRLSPTCCTVAVTPLLRELLFCATTLSLLYEESGVYTRMLAVLIDELAVATVEGLHWPMPTDQRLRMIVNLMMASPADRGSLNVWAGKAGMSARLFERLIARETGMRFGRWRQQLSVVLAVKWLAGGDDPAGRRRPWLRKCPEFRHDVSEGAGDVPGRYMAERYSGR